MLLDSGADISGLPRPVVEALALPIGDQSYEIMAYDNSTRECATVLAEIVFLRGHFKGQFIVLDHEVGVLGRNVGYSTMVAVSASPCFVVVLLRFHGNQNRMLQPSSYLLVGSLPFWNYSNKSR